MTFFTKKIDLIIKWYFVYQNVDLVIKCFFLNQNIDDINFFLIKTIDLITQLLLLVKY